MVPLVEARGVTKRFPGVVANDGVDLELVRGEVHTILGENGAGKSTLAALLSGLYRPDDGVVLVDGTPVDFHSPRDGLAHGIGMVHQHPRLVERFTVAENVALGDPRLPVILSPKSLQEEVAVVAERFGLPVDPAALTADLALGQRQRVEIVKALARGVEVLLLDEPTAVLTPAEVDALFDTVRSMRAAGKCIVFISHKLGEVTQISDRITVMRDGRVTGDVTSSQLTDGSVDQHDLARMMVGRDVELVSTRATSEPGPTVLSVEALNLRTKRRPVLNDLSFTVRGGEIVGVAGVSGNGQLELAETLAGMRRPTSGRVQVEGGLAYIPEERLGTGLVPNLSITDNMLLTDRRGLFVNRRRARAAARQLIDDYEVKTPGAATAAGKLSGGNAQKVLLGRELAADVSVVVAASPTRGLDVGAIESVRSVFADLRDRGVGVLLISEDLEEVLALSDRVLVLYRGSVSLETPGADASVEAIGRAMAGVT